MFLTFIPPWKGLKHGSSTLEAVLNVKPRQLMFNQGSIDYLTCVKKSNDLDHFSAQAGHIFVKKVRNYQGSARQ